MDIILDLWVHAIYNDSQVQGSELGPVVYFRNCTGNPLTSYSDLSLRWGISKATVSRILNKLQEKEYLSLVSFTGRHGSVIYLCSYLSTMFNVSDVMIDKEEVSMTFQVPVHITENAPIPENTVVREEQIYIAEEPDTVSSLSGSVSKSHICQVIRKTAEILAAQGIPCCECSETLYKLYPLSDCRETDFRYSLKICCPDGGTPYQFELTLFPAGSAKSAASTIQEQSPKTTTINAERR